MISFTSLWMIALIKIFDKDEYPQTAEIESRCVNILANLWNSSAENAIGCSTTGSSEAAMLGGMAMKWRWRDKMKAQGKDYTNLILLQDLCKCAGINLLDIGILSLEKFQCRMKV